MTQYLCPLAMKALSCPFRHILSEGRPDEFFSDRLPSPLYTWVAEIMNEVKNSLSPREGDERARRAVRNINNKFPVPNINGAQLQTRSCIIGNPPEICVQRLVSRHRLKIETHLTNRVDDAVEIVESFLLDVSVQRLRRGGGGRGGG